MCHSVAVVCGYGLNLHAYPTILAPVNCIASSFPSFKEKKLWRICSCVRLVSAYLPSILCIFVHFKALSFAFVFKSRGKLLSWQVSDSLVSDRAWSMETVQYHHPSETLQHCTFTVSPPVCYSPPPALCLDLYSCNWGQRPHYSMHCSAVWKVLQLPLWNLKHQLLLSCLNILYTAEHLYRGRPRHNKMSVVWGYIMYIKLMSAFMSVKKQTNNKKNWYMHSFHLLHWGQEEEDT